MSTESEDKSTQVSSPQELQTQEIQSSSPSSEEESDYSDDSELSNESNTQEEPVKEEVKESSSIVSQIGAWVNKNREMSFAVVFGVLAFGFAASIRSSSH